MRFNGINANPVHEKDCVPPQEFVRMLKASIYAAVKRVEITEM